MPTFLQTIRAIGGLMDRAASHCTESGADAFAKARIIDDMAPFHVHAVTAYDIRRMCGVALEKRDCEGSLRPRTG